jgi:C-terminal processing protease CtpA/Prc
MPWPQDSLAATFKAETKQEALQQVNVLLGALGDPFTRVLLPQDAASFQAQTEGKVGAVAQRAGAAPCESLCQQSGGRGPPAASLPSAATQLPRACASATVHLARPLHLTACACLCIPLHARPRLQVVSAGVMLDSDRDGSLRVVGVVPGSPAQLAGLQPGDEVVAVNGTPLAPNQDPRWVASPALPALAAARSGSHQL